METQQVQFAKIKINQEPENPASLSSVVNKYFYHWPLFVIGIGISLAAAVFYLKSMPAEYKIKATLLIKDEMKTPDQQSALHEIDLATSSKIIENEIEVLKSKQLVNQIISDLNLNIAYQKKDGLSFEDLYKNSPVYLSLLEPGDLYKNRSVEIVIIDEKSFTLKNPSGYSKNFLFKDTFKNGYGKFKLIPTNYLKNFIGQTIVIRLLSPEQLALKYQHVIEVTSTNKLSTAILISMNESIPERGKDILNRMIYNYHLIDKTEQNRQIESTLQFLDQRIAALSNDLTDAEKGIAGFKSSRGLIDLGSNSKISLENMQSNDLRLNDTNIQLEVIDGIDKYINSSQNSERIPATMGITDPALSSSIEKLTILQLQRESFLATTPETNPDFEPINRQINVTKAAIRENIKSIKSNLLRTQQKLQAFNTSFEGSIKQMPSQEREYISIKRQQAIKENLYTYLLQKKEEVSVNYASSFTDDRVLDFAYAEWIENPKKKLGLLLAFLVGIGFPAALIFVRNTFNGKITDANQIRQIITMPIVAEVSMQEENKPVINIENSNASSEQFRDLRARLYSLYGDKKKGRVSLITSSVPGEGKSFVTINLAAVLAFANRKSVLVELDLRKPAIARELNLADNHLGISDFLAGNVEIDQIIQQTDVSANLDVISCGGLTHRPSELLESEKLKELFLILRDRYDDVIIDSPPVHLVADALIISRLADFTFYVVRQGFTEKSELVFLHELIQQKQLSNVKLVFNGIQRLRYGYGFNYDESYNNPAKSKSLIKYLFRNFKSRF